MKHYIRYSIIAGLALSLTFSSCGGGSADDADLADSTGLPGDHFSLAAALDLFKESDDLKDFEKQLNTKDNKVNNLDLNGDNKIDYIRVIDKVRDNSHVIVLQVPVNEKESQDVAIIGIMKTGEKSAVLQIIGDELLYGDSAIYEPAEGGKTEQASLMPAIFHETQAAVGVNVYLWTPVRTIYEPAYIPYVSPVVWNVYPAWYTPWPPYPYGWYRREVAHSKKAYYPVAVIRPFPAGELYFASRSYSPFVFNRYQTVYKQNGWPKMKGKSYYGPGVSVYQGGHRVFKPMGNGKAMKPYNGKGGKGFEKMGPPSAGGKKLSQPNMNGGGSKGGPGKIQSKGSDGSKGGISGGSKGASGGGGGKGGSSGKGGGGGGKK